MASFFPSAGDESSDGSESNGKINVGDLMLIMESNGIKIDKAGLDKIEELGSSGQIDKKDLIKLFNSSQNWRNELELNKQRNAEAYRSDEQEECRKMERAEAFSNSKSKPFSKNKKQDSGYKSMDRDGGYMDMDAMEKPDTQTVIGNTNSQNNTH